MGEMGVFPASKRSVLQEMKESQRKRQKRAHGKEVSTSLFYVAPTGL